jgi:hypothetical protein
MKTKHHLIPSKPVIQSGVRTLNNAICRRWFALALGGFLFTSIFALSAPPVVAQCQQWSVGHGWRLKQGGINVDMDLHQNGTVVTGTARFFEKGYASSGGNFGSAGGDVNGDVDGTVKGDRFAVIIHWDNGTTGVYNGTVGPSGRIEGTGYNQATPSQKVNWYSETHMVCGDAAPTAATKPKPILHSGKAKLAPSPMNTYNANDPNRPRGFINGIQLATPTPTPSAGADESSSDDQHKKNKKNKKKHHHQKDDDQNQGND